MRSIQLVPTMRRRQPGWDGTTRRLIALFSPTDGAVLSIDPGLTSLFGYLPIDDSSNDSPNVPLGTSAQATQEVDPLSLAKQQSPDRSDADSSPSAKDQPAEHSSNDQGLSSVARLIEDSIGPGSCFTAYFRFAFEVPGLGSPGVWLPANDKKVPEWLKPFGGDVLVAIDRQGQVLAGVGLKRHDRFARELAVVTEPDARGKGLAKALVAQAAQHVLQQGMVPTYLHAQNNFASARVAEATGFTDRGWRLLGLNQTGEALLAPRPH